MLKAMVIGNLGKDAVVNNVNGKTVINFTLAHTEKDRQGNAKTTWIECAYWSEKTGIAPYLKKGVKVFVEGKPEVKVWESNTGAHGATFQVFVHSVELLSAGQQPTQQAQPQQQRQAESVDEDLPF